MSGLNKRLVERALAVGGTASGEHGVGVGKREHLVEEHGDAAVALMAAIKHAVDPLHIMNPGKILNADYGGHPLPVQIL